MGHNFRMAERLNRLVARLLSIECFKEGLDTHMEALEQAVEETNDNYIKNHLLHELVMVTEMNLTAAREMQRVNNSIMRLLAIARE